MLFDYCVERELLTENPMDKVKIKLVAFDLDGTLTQHKEPLEPQQREALLRLSKKYKLLMVGAGQVMRIFNQMEKYPIDIIGNYGMQYAKYNYETKALDLVRNDGAVCKNKEEAEEKLKELGK